MGGVEVFFACVGGVEHFFACVGMTAVWRGSLRSSSVCGSCKMSLGRFEEVLEVVETLVSLGRLRLLEGGF